MGAPHYQYSPWSSLETNADTIHNSIAIRVIVGALTNKNQNLRKYLEDLKSPAGFVDTSCGHDFGCLLDAVGRDTFAFIATYTR